MKRLSRTFCVSILVALSVLAATAKRIPPKPVAPVIADGVRYSAAGDGRNAYVVASDIATERELWKVRVFHTHIKFWMEEDVQWVFIANLKLVDDSLMVRDERGRCYAVSLKTKRVKRNSCSNVHEVGSPAK